MTKYFEGLPDEFEEEPVTALAFLTLAFLNGLSIGLFLIVLGL